MQMESAVTRIFLLAFLALISAQPAAADWCSGIITSNGTCIGSQGNMDAPVVYCDDQTDSRCRRR
jgi:hypothetical protein